MSGVLDAQSEDEGIGIADDDALHDALDARIPEAFGQAVQMHGPLLDADLAGLFNLVDAHRFELGQSSQTQV